LRYGNIVALSKRGAMKRLFALLTILAAGSAIAEGFPCSEVQYAFLKDASKDELREEYCRLTRKALSNEKSYQSTGQAIEEKRTLQLDTSKDRDMAMAELRASHTCKVAAGAISDALSRRFKSKPPASCT
jgi:hypothetical protein